MTDRMESVELLGCPFCGGKADFEEVTPQGGSFVFWSVGCQSTETDCVAYQMIAHYNRKCEAAAAWNRRASPAGGESAWMIETVDAIISDNVYVDNDGVAGISQAAEAVIEAFRATPPAAAQLVDIEAAVAATAKSIMAIRMMVDERAEAFVRKELEALIRAVQSGGDACPTDNPNWPANQPCSVCGAFGPWFDTPQIGECPTIQAADEVDALRAQLEATRKALGPFSSAANGLTANLPDQFEILLKIDAMPFARVKVGEFRAAIAALEGTQS